MDTYKIQTMDIHKLATLSTRQVMESFVASGYAQEMADESTVAQYIEEGLHFAYFYVSELHHQLVAVYTGKSQDNGQSYNLYVRLTPEGLRGDF